MAEAILGLSAFYHDSAAALVMDGEIVAAAHEWHSRNPAMEFLYRHGLQRR